MNILDINYHPKLIDIMLKSTSVGALSVNIFTPYLLAYFFYGTINDVYLYAWLVLNTVIFLFRIFLIKLGFKANTKQDRKDINKILHLTYFTIFLSSILHGYALWYSSSYISHEELFFIAFVMIAMVSASISTLGSVFHAYAIYVFFNLIAIIIVFSFKGGAMYYLVSMALVVYTYVMIKSGYLHHKILNESIVLKESFESRVEESTLELKKNNKRLKESIVNFKDLQDTSMVMLIIHDESGSIIDVNQLVLEKYGYVNKEELVGHSILEFLPEKSIPIAYEAMKNERSDPYELIMKTKDNVEFPALISARYSILNGQRVRMTTMMDLTELKEQEYLLQKQSKLAQMGEMLSMIAHQWRQPLNAISATSTSLNVKATLNKIDKEMVLEMTENISQYSQHLSNTIDDFRNFFKPNKETTETSFHSILESVLKIVNVSIEKENIRLIKELEYDGHFESYESELKQVALSLFKNAEDALVDNRIENPYIKIAVKKENDNIVFELSDNAGGIPKDIIEKIFDPYFSTKKQKDGTGLGLYMSKIIIEEHCKGKITVSNDKDGAVFRIVLKESCNDR